MDCNCKEIDSSIYIGVALDIKNEDDFRRNVLMYVFVYVINGRR